MDSPTARNVALLSIHPEFVERIFDGTKTIELRRISLPSELKHVVVYSTAPIMKIAGFFDVEEIDDGKVTVNGKTEHRKRNKLRKRKERIFQKSYES